ncbi:HD domain-containing protein [Candidatus Desantisbacteria bacterium]|nr:HD domain-containing protein [Candidatus Desantisbacteria bacterium]
MNRTEQLEKELSLMTQKLLSTYEELGLVYDLVSRLGNILDTDRVSSEVLNEAVNISGARWGFVMLIDEKTGRLHLKASQGLDEIAQRLIEDEYERGRGLISRVMEEGRPMIGDEILSEEEALFDLKSSVLVVPLGIKEKRVGAICLSDKLNGQPFYSTDMKLLETLGVIVSIIIENARLYTNIQNLFFSAVESLSFAIDEKDTYTHGHSKRVTEYSLGLADELGLSDKERVTLKLAAIMHDVGKIGVPEEVLHKEGKLDDNDWEKIKKHPIKGAHILEPIGDLKSIPLSLLQMTFEEIRAITPGVKHHHERYDGKGYPDKLIDKNIPLIARIIAVADAYDAMTSDRAYRKGMSQQEACKELKRNAGSQHDPEIIEAFLRLRGYEEVIT